MQAERRSVMYPAKLRTSAWACIAVVLLAATAACAQTVAARELDPRLVCAGVPDYVVLAPSVVHISAGSAFDRFSDSVLHDILLATILSTVANKGLDGVVSVGRTMQRFGDDPRSRATATQYFDGVAERLELNVRGHRPSASCVSWRSVTETVHEMLAACRSGDVTGVAEAFYFPDNETEVRKVTTFRSSGSVYNVETDSYLREQSPLPDFDVEVSTSHAIARLAIVELAMSELQVDDGTGRLTRCQLMDATVRVVESD